MKLDPIKFKKYIDKFKVILSNLLFWMVIVHTGLTAIIASGQLEMFPDMLNSFIVVTSAIGSVIIFIRRVTPVSKDERGLLPK